MIPLILQLTLVLEMIQDLVKLDLQQILVRRKTMVSIICLHYIKGFYYLICNNFSDNFWVLSFQVQLPDMTKMKVARKDGQRNCTCLAQRCVIVLVGYFAIIMCLYRVPCCN